MTAIILAILTFIGWGSGDIFGAISSRRLGAARSSMAITVFVLIFLLPLAPFMDTTGLTSSVIWQSAILGLILGTAYLCFVEGLRIGNPAIVGTISGSYTGAAVILSLLFLNESLNAGQFFFISVIVAGVIGASLDIRGLRQRKARVDKSVALAFATLFCWSIYFTFMKVPINDAGWYWPSLISTITSFIPYALAHLVEKPSPAKYSTWRQGLKPALITAVVGGTATVLYNVALSYGNVSIVAPIAGSYLILFVILASLVFKEPMSRQQTAGIAVCVCGIVGLSLLSS